MQVAVESVAFGHVGPTGSTLVFQDFDLAIESRSVHAIVGPSGCGKSTLLRLIAGLEQPLRGRIRVGGTPGATNRVALVFQDPSLLPWWDVGRNVAISAEFDRKRRPIYDKIREFNLDRVGISDLARRRPNTLSRGQQTRASIARAMAHDAAVTLLDEPFIHLDAITRQRMWSEFETHWQIEARTYVLVTHDVNEAVLLADRITVLSGDQPCSVVETIDVGINRPRGVNRMGEPAFRSAVARVWEALEPGRS